MDPHSDKLPALALPQPSAEHSSGGFVVEPTIHASRPETLPAYQESQPVISQSAPPTIQPAPLPMAPVMPPPTQATATVQPVATTPADDTSTDELDREWIMKAKAIVEKTKSDPYIESRELGKVKSDYMKIRYNKDIKVAEDGQ